MVPYANLSGNSPIIGYEMGDDFIRIFFKGNSIYLYNYNKPGSVRVEKMKSLATAGKGLSAFITRSVGKDFAVKEK